MPSFMFSIPDPDWMSLPNIIKRTAELRSVLYDPITLTPLQRELQSILRECRGNGASRTADVLERFAALLGGPQYALPRGNRMRDTGVLDWSLVSGCLLVPINQHGGHTYPVGNPVLMVGGGLGVYFNRRGEWQSGNHLPQELQHFRAITDEEIATFARNVLNRELILWTGLDGRRSTHNLTTGSVTGGRARARVI